MMTMMFYVNNNNNDTKCSSNNATTGLLTAKQLHSGGSSSSCGGSSCLYGCCCCQIERTENVYKTNNNNNNNNISGSNNIKDIYNSSNKRIPITYDLEAERHYNDSNNSYSNSSSSSSSYAMPLKNGRGMISNSNTILTTAGIKAATTLSTQSSLTLTRQRRKCIAAVATSDDNNSNNPSLVVARRSSSKENSKSCSLHSSEFGENKFCCLTLATPALANDIIAATAKTRTATSTPLALNSTLLNKCKNYSLKTTTITTNRNNHSNHSSSSSNSTNNSSHQHCPKQSAAYRRRHCRVSHHQLISNVHNFISLFGLQLCCLLLLRLSHLAIGLAIVGGGGGMDSTNANLTDMGSSAPKYQTAYACEGKKLTIECDPGDLINLIRANYGRFSITICNDHGNMEWSVNCMFPKSLTVLNSRCAHKQSCSVLATTSMFGDPCPGTHKYLEAHYQCISASQTSTTTNRPSPPPWVLSNSPPLLPNGSSSIINPAVLSPPLPPAQRPQMPIPGLANTNLPLGGLPNAVPSSPGPPTIHTTLPGGRLKAGYNSTASKTPTRHDGLPPPPPLHHHHHTSSSSSSSVVGGHHSNNNDQGNENPNKGSSEHNPLETKTSKAPVSNSANNNNGNGNSTAPPNTRILTGVGGTGSDDGTLLTTKTTTRGQQQQSPVPTGTTTASSLGSVNNTMGAGVIKSINNINLNTGLGGEDETNMFCGPTNARNLFWNMTRVGDVNVQPCPGGATGIAKWRCVLMKRITLDDDDDTTGSTQTPICNGTSCINLRLRNFEPTWHPLTPDLTQCRSLWLNNLEVRVNHRDSSLISIANDLSEVTSSKTLYGGDMLVTTKIIQAMSEKMYHDKETFPDQRLREAMILELLQGVVKTGSNLLDESQLSSWLDLNQEDQMRVATSLLTGLEENAFLLADTIIRERNVVQKVKNILLSVRVLETKSIQNNEVFPDAEQWQISDDRIELPRAALIENSEGGLVRIVFAAFDRLESILKPSYDHFDLKSARSYIRNTAILANDSDTTNSQQRIRILNSKVISASLGKGRHIQLSQPIKLVLRHLKTENVTNPTCVFWNYIDHAWSANGCILESTNRTHSVCMCNHLTNFAILMDVMDDHTHSLFTMFDGNMRILIYVSVSICLVFIVIALLTLKIFNGVFIKVRSTRNQQQENLNRSSRRGQGGGLASGGGGLTNMGGSTRRQNNIIDQTHESIQITNTTTATTNHTTTNATNNIQNLQQQLNLQHLQNLTQAPSNLNANNFIQHNSIRNSNRNNLNANNFNLQQLQQQQQQQQQQQVVAAAAAAVVVANNSNSNQRNLQMNNLNLNLNLQPPHSHHHNHGHNLNHNHLNHQQQQQMETSMSNTSAAAVAAAASIAAALQQHHNNVNTAANTAAAAAGVMVAQASNNLNVNNNNNNRNNNNNNSNNNNSNNRMNNSDPNNIIMQGNMDDLQYKWWWW